MGADLESLLPTAVATIIHLRHLGHIQQAGVELHVERVVLVTSESHLHPLAFLTKILKSQCPSIFTM
jgi:hypothetical protein